MWPHGTQDGNHITFLTSEKFGSLKHVLKALGFGQILDLNIIPCDFFF